MSTRPSISIPPAAPCRHAPPSARSSGNCWRMRANSSGTSTGHRVGVTPRMILPLGCASWARISSPVRSTSRRMRVALSSSFWPASVRRTPRLTRVNSADAEFVLQPLHLPRQRRLRDAQMRRGAGDAAEFGDTDEIAEAAQFHPGGTSYRLPMPQRYGADQNSAFARWRDAPLACATVSCEEQSDEAIPCVTSRRWFIRRGIASSLCSSQ